MKLEGLEGLEAILRINPLMKGNIPVDPQKWFQPFQPFQVREGRRCE